jgi:vancomycin resistance protein YoaR
MPYEEVPVPSSSEDLAQLGINEMISVGRTSFVNSEAYRVTNIVAGMRLLHGVLIAPGEEFSFNETIGSIGPHNGFVQGYAIVNDNLAVEWGGGICQDSTTLFRTAFWAGLPITERSNHSQYLYWYDAFGYGDYGNGPGIDSAIFLGGPDLRFVNDTGNWILMQAYAHPGSAVAEIYFYGTKGGRTVEFAGPNISYAGGRMQVAFTRIIKQDGVEVNRRTYWSVFK